MEDENIIIETKKNEISATENRVGRFLLVYNGECTSLERLSIYRNRNSIEKAFRTLKTDLDIEMSVIRDLTYVR